MKIILLLLIFIVVIDGFTETLSRNRGCRRVMTSTRIWSGAILAEVVLSAALLSHSSHYGARTQQLPFHEGSLLVALESGDELARLKRGSGQVSYLLENWQTKTTYCNFGEFNNDLLAPENKKELMKEAAAGGLLDYDKSATMTVKCKRDPMIVRAFAGLMDENPTLNNAVKLMQSEKALNRVLEADRVEVEEYMSAVDSYEKALAEVDLLSYSARTGYASTETQTLEESKRYYEQAEQGLGKKDFLIQTRESMAKLDTALKKIVEALAL